MITSPAYTLLPTHPQSRSFFGGEREEGIELQERKILESARCRYSSSFRAFSYIYIFTRHACIQESCWTRLSVRPRTLDMAYKEVFRAPLADKTITPDRSYCLRELGRRFAERTVNCDSALLRSCQQVYNEATGTLYGSQVFCFDDTSYGHENTAIEASANCCHWLRERSILQDDLPSMTTFNRRCDAYDGKHYVEIPHCDFVGINDWLLNIGERNRLKIRHFTLVFLALSSRWCVGGF